MTSTKTSSSLFLAGYLRPEPGPKNSKIRISMSNFGDNFGLKWKATLEKRLSRLNKTVVQTNCHENFATMMLSHYEGKVGVNFDSGSYLPDSAVFRQRYSFRAYEVGPTGKVSIETLMNLVKEMGINSIKGMGLEIDRMGSTPRMRKRDLVWITTKVQVKIDRYPSCDDIVEVDNWKAHAGKSCMRYDALIRDCRTRDTLLRATSTLGTMNMKTRRVSGIPDEVRAEVGFYLRDVPPILEDDNRHLVKLDENTAGYVCPNLKPRRSDLDTTQHVRTVKYIDWIFESVPNLLLENHELSRITMEYISECHKNNTVNSLTTVSGSGGGSFVDPRRIECCHLLKLDSGQEIMKARTEWRPKYIDNFVNLL